MCKRKGRVVPVPAMKTHSRSRSSIHSLPCLALDGGDFCRYKHLAYFLLQGVDYLDICAVTR